MLGMFVGRNFQKPIAAAFATVFAVASAVVTALQEVYHTPRQSVAGCLHHARAPPHRQVCLDVNRAATGRS